jgi:hypothetical protein
MTPAFGAVVYDQPVTNNVIYGTGNTNGNTWSVDQESPIGLELALRAHTRFPAPLNDFPNDGIGDYGGFPAGGFNGGGSSSWNFDWSVNSNYNTNGGVLNLYTYTLSLDTDPTAGVTLQSIGIDPVNFCPGSPVNDSAQGTNATPQSGGTVYPNCGAYTSGLATNNLVQNSWRYAFFPSVPFDPNTPGVYTIDLKAFYASGLSAGQLAGEVSINVDVTPEPATLGFLGAGLAVLALVSRRCLKAKV